MPKNWKLASNSGIQTDQILSNDDEVCIPSLSSILLAVKELAKYVVKKTVISESTNTTKIRQ